MALWPSVRFGSKADICSAKRHVRSTPESGQIAALSVGPSCANKRHHRAYQSTASWLECMDHALDLTGRSNTTGLFAAPSLVRK